MKKLTALLAAFCLLLSAAALADCPHIDAGDYPTPDGSTATLPLSYLLYQRATGLDEAAAKSAIQHHKTSESFYELAWEHADLLLVYEPSQDAWDDAMSMGVALEYKPTENSYIQLMFVNENDARKAYGPLRYYYGCPWRASYYCR